MDPSLASEPRTLQQCTVSFHEAVCTCSVFGPKIWSEGDHLSVPGSARVSGDADLRASHAALVSFHRASWCGPAPGSLTPWTPGPGPADWFPDPQSLALVSVCSVVGQFLADPTTRCRYLECSYGNDPWPDASGVIPLIQVPRPCAPGTAVPLGYIGGLTNPCTSGAAECKRTCHLRG